MIMQSYRVGLDGDRVLNDDLDDLLDRLETASSGRALRSALESFGGRTGFDHFAYVHLRGPVAEIFTDYPREWRERYFENRYDAVDPVIVAARRSLKIERWSGDAAHIRRGSTQWLFFRDAAAYGLRSGISVPIRVGFGGTAVLAFASARREIDVRSIEAARAHTAVAFLHLKLAEFGGTNPASYELELTPRETLCLTWASLGKTMKETATLIGVNERTVRFYLDEAKAKLGAHNIAHAIRLGIEHGFL